MNSKLKSKSSVDSKIKDELLNIEIGDRGILPYRLSFTKLEDKTPFDVVYELDIIDISKDKVKVKATGFTSTSSVANDPHNSAGIVLFMQNKWVNKKDVEIVIDESKRRSNKINSILE